MSKENLEKKFLVLIRETMIPIWKGIHENDLAWKRIRVMPDIYSEAMCRHSCCYMIRLFKELSIYRNFKPVKGSVSIPILERAPFYLSNDPTHYVLMREDGMCLDLTADQFGKDPLMLHHWSDYFKEEPQEVAIKHGSLSTWTKLPSYKNLINEIRNLGLVDEVV
jgi:hypothetical protein